MHKCPNCGQSALRTKDWACQWCGYPLISTAYRQIDKTYQELKAEGLGEPRAGVMAVAEVPTPPSEVATPPAPAPEVKPEAEPEAEPTLEVEVAPVVEVEPEPVPEPERKPKAKVKPKKEVKPKAQRKTKAKAERKAKVKPEPVVEAKPEPVAKSKAEAVVEAEPEPVVESKAEAVVEAEPEPVPVPKPEIVADAIAVTTEEMHKAFRESSSAAEKKFAGKTLHVTGVVSIIATGDEAETPSLILTGHDVTAMENIVCMFDEKYRAELSHLTEEQTVTVQGKYESRTMSILLLVDCVLVS